MFDRDWQPSTVIDAPLTQLARGGGEEGDDGADFVGAAEAAERQLARDELGDALGIGLLALVPRSARETGSSPGATLLTRMLSGASCCASDFARLISAALTAL